MKKLKADQPEVILVKVALGLPRGTAKVEFIPNKLTIPNKLMRDCPLGGKTRPKAVAHMVGVTSGVITTDGILIAPGQAVGAAATILA